MAQVDVVLPTSNLPAGAGVNLDASLTVQRNRMTGHQRKEAPDADVAQNDHSPCRRWEAAEAEFGARGFSAAA